MKENTKKEESQTKAKHETKHGKRRVSKYQKCDF